MAYSSRGIRVYYHHGGEIWQQADTAARIGDSLISNHKKKAGRVNWRWQEVLEPQSQPPAMHITSTAINSITNWEPSFQITENMTVILLKSPES